MVDLRDDPIELVPPRPDAWRAAYEREHERLHEVLLERGLADAVVRIEHVGSTAVPDLAAKDVVDVDVVVADGAVPDVSGAIVEGLSGTRYENSASWHPVARRQDGQRFNDHVFGESDDGWKLSVVTREVLRDRPSLRDEYERVKRRLAAEHDDLEAYSVGKSEVLDRVVETAREDPAFEFDFRVPEPKRAGEDR